MALAAGTLLGPYQVLSALGAGGQGEVYKALDTTLDRTVVVKVLTPERSPHASSRARFEREAKLASALDHPNICTIHGLFDINGVNFIAMQYIEGQTVRQLVAGRPLELRSALSIAIQVADALAAAHARGIIHRDIKAGNVMVMEAGMVKVLDFGLAKLLERPEEDSKDPHLTELGVPYGTATYAAPEQASGGPVDHRADIFSTGVLLYEMLAGTWPFHGKTAVDVRYAVLHETPVSIADMRGVDSPAIARLQEVLNRALAKKPEDRYQNIEEFRDELRALLQELDPENSQPTSFTGGIEPVAPRYHSTDTKAGPSRSRSLVLAVAATLLLALSLSALVYFKRSQQTAVESLAVLPFTNASGNVETEYLSDGITESLINSLSQLPAVKVRSRNSVFHYKGKTIDPSKAGRELGVQAVLTGRVEQRGDALMISVELIDVKDDSHMWGARYDRNLSDLLTVQQELSRNITEQLRLRLTGTEEKQLAKDYNTSTEAYQLYLQGRYYWNQRTEDGLKKGIEYFEKATLKDPNYAPAYSGLADCYSLLNVYNIEPATVSNDKARDAATRALQLDESLADAHASLASVLYRYYWNWDEAEQHFKRAIQLNPNYATARQWYSAMLAARGRFAEANAQALQAQESEPLSLTIRSDVGRHLYFARQFDQSLAEHRKSVEMDPAFARAYCETGYVLDQLGKRDEAISEFQKALSLNGKYVNALSGLGYALGVAGRNSEARGVIRQLQELGRQHYVSPYHLAVVYAGIGDKKEALTLLEKALDERFNWMVFIGVEPQFDGLRQDPRFAALERRMGLIQ
jgi:eukaryotic-like serine/threonine-protein kinase